MRFEGGSPYTLYAFVQATIGQPRMTSLTIMPIPDNTNNDIGTNPSAHPRCDP